MPRLVRSEALAAFDALLESGATLVDAVKASGLSMSTAQRRVRDREYAGHKRRQAILRFSQDLATVTPCLAHGCDRMVEVPTKGTCYAHYKKLRTHGQYEVPGVVFVGDRRCSDCGETRPVTSFPLHKPSPGGRRSNCRGCYNRKQRVQKERTLLLSKYGLSRDDYNAMLLAQGGVCAICKSDPPASRRLAVDHCHDKGHVRGLLCGRCNVALGHMRDDPERLEAAAAYLRERG